MHTETHANSNATTNTNPDAASNPNPASHLHLGDVVGRLMDQTMSMPQVLQELKVTPEILAVFCKQPHVREALDALTYLWHLRADLLAAEASSEAMLTMIELARCAERHSPELARRAAAAILKHQPHINPANSSTPPSTPNPTPTPPSPPKGEREPGVGQEGQTSKATLLDTSSPASKPSSSVPLPPSKGLVKGSADHQNLTTHETPPPRPPTNGSAVVPHKQGPSSTPTPPTRQTTQTVAHIHHNTFTTITDPLASAAQTHNPHSTHPPPSPTDERPIASAIHSPTA